MTKHYISTADIRHQDYLDIGGLPYVVDYVTDQIDGYVHLALTALYDRSDHIRIRVDEYVKFWVWRH